VGVATGRGPRRERSDRPASVRKRVGPTSEAFVTVDCSIEGDHCAHMAKTSCDSLGRRKGGESLGGLLAPDGWYLVPTVAFGSRVDGL
jgi:hypothetical protein